MFADRRRVAWNEIVRVGIIVLLLIIIGWLLVNRHTTPMPDNAVSVPAMIAPELKHEATVATPIKTGIVRTYKPAMKATLKLPDSVVKNDAQAVIAASRVKSDDHPQTVTTVIDSTTGETETYVHEEPMPWLAWDTRGDAGLYLGLKNGKQSARLEVRQGLVAIKAAHIGAIASADFAAGSTSTFAGFGVWMRW